MDYLIRAQEAADAHDDDGREEGIRRLINKNGKPGLGGGDPSQAAGVIPMALPLHRLLKPRSVAVVGASDKPGALGMSVIGNLDRLGFAGDIHLVNPKRDRIGHRSCLRSIADLPAGVDAAVLAIPQAGVLDAVRALAERRVGAAVIFAAGFAESGSEGLARQREIAAVAARAGMVVEGPNCLGLVNFVDGVALTFIETAAVAATQGRGIGIVSQSGALAAVVDTVLLSRGLRLTYSVSTGNEAASGVEDYLDFLVDDPETRVIGLVVEQFRAPGRFLAAARRAAAAGKPVVLLHPGRSAAARASAATHTGAMAGDHALMAAKAAREGVVLPGTVEELGDCLELIARAPAADRGGTLVIGESGAFKALTLDFAEAVGLALPPAHDADSPALRAALPAFVAVSNPVDMTAQGLVEPALYGRLVEAAVADDRFGSVLLGIIQTDPVTCGIKFPAIIAALQASRPAKPVVVAGLDEGAAIPAGYVEQLRALDIPYFPGPERALRALARLSAQAARDTARRAPAPTPLGERPRGVVPEYRAKALLRPLGILFPEARLAASPAEAARAAAALGYPVALKAQSAGLPYKSDAGGVIVGIPHADALAQAWHTMHADLARNRPDVVLDGILVERMGARGLELIVGARNDPDWGPVLLAGLGGVRAELTPDVRLMAPDLTRAGIVAELMKLRGAALLTGFRGSSPVDLDAVAGIVEALAGLILAEPAIREIDLNPVIAYPRGQGALALDALIVMDG